MRQETTTWHFRKIFWAILWKRAKTFIQKKIIVYNVHSLLHIADDCEHFKTSLNEISAFPFENYLHSIKKLVKNAKNPIVQVAKRIQEKNNASVIIPKRRSTFSVISTSEKNNSLLLRNGTYVVLTEKLDKMSQEQFHLPNVQAFSNWMLFLPSHVSPRCSTLPL